MDFVYACVLICVGIQLTTTQPLPSTRGDRAIGAEYSASTPKMIQVVGGWISLECAIPNWEKHPISWSKTLSGDSASYLEISRGTELRVQDDRYTLVEDPQHSRINLRIRNVKEADSGLYQCTNTAQFSLMEVEILPK